MIAVSTLALEHDGPSPADEAAAEPAAPRARRRRSSAADRAEAPVVSMPAALVGAGEALTIAGSSAAHVAGGPGVAAVALATAAVGYGAHAVRAARRSRERAAAQALLEAAKGAGAAPGGDTRRKPSAAVSGRPRAGADGARPRRLGLLRASNGATAKRGGGRAASDASAVKAPKKV